MDASLRSVYEHMIDLGCGSLSHANYLGHFYDMKNFKWNELGVLQAAHSCEIFLKARLAQEHPLLIFDSLPKSTSSYISSSGVLDFNSLLQAGRTIDYADLPEKVWAATGFKFTERQMSIYKEFGKLRNSIQHFASPNYDVSELTSRYVFEFIDPFINSQWGLFAIDFCDDHEPYEYFVEVLARRNIEFLVSPKLGAEVLDYIKEGTSAYQAAVLTQITQRGYL